MRSRALLMCCLVVACGEKQQSEPPPEPQPPPTDAGLDGITAIGGFDPDGGMHLDDDSPNGKTTPGSKKRAGVPIGITLKSDPPGAKVYVDGEFLGHAPKYWAGIADGTEHEFAFTYPGYALARYKFAPISNGTLHATLEPIIGELPDAGLEPVIAPKLAPDAAPPPPRVAPDAAVAPPPTVLTPVDAAVAPDARGAPDAAAPD